MTSTNATPATVGTRPTPPGGVQPVDPTGEPSWPLILIEGGEKVGKSWLAAEFTGSPRVGRAFWIDLGEGVGDEYGKVPGAKYKLLPHDGTWGSIMQWVTYARDEATYSAANGEPPVVLVIDNMSAIWDLLKDWVSLRAAQSDYNKRLLAKDPNAEVKASMNLWNDATARHDRLLDLLKQFPGIAVIIARGKEVSAMDDAGQPIKGTKDYKVDSQKEVPAAASVWIRLSREEAPLIIGARTTVPDAGVRPGINPPRAMPDLSIERVVFDVLGCGKDTQARKITEARPDVPVSEIRNRALQLGADGDKEALKELYYEAGELGKLAELTTDGSDDETTVKDLIIALAAAC